MSIEGTIVIDVRLILSKISYSLFSVVSIIMLLRGEIREDKICDIATMAHSREGIILICVCKDHFPILSSEL